MIMINNSVRDIFHEILEPAFSLQPILTPPKTRSFELGVDFQILSNDCLAGPRRIRESGESSRPSSLRMLLSRLVAWRLWGEIATRERIIGATGRRNEVGCKRISGAGLFVVDLSRCSRCSCLASNHLVGDPPRRVHSCRQE